MSIVVYTVLQRDSDKQMFSSPHGKEHNGKSCTTVCALTPEHPTLGQFWDRQVAQTVVKLEDGMEIVVLNDEVKG